MIKDDDEFAATNPAGHPGPAEDVEEHGGVDDTDAVPPPSAANMVASGRRTRWGQPNW